MKLIEKLRNLFDSDPKLKDDYIFLLKENCQLKEENISLEYANNKLVKDLTLKNIDLVEMGYKNGLFTYELSGEAVRLMAEHYYTILKDRNPTNYLEMQFNPKGSSEFITVTIQKHDKKTPHQCRQEAENEVVRLKKILEENNIKY